MLEKLFFYAPRVSGLCLLATFLTFPSLCPGEASPAKPKAASLTVQGSIRSRLEAWDWFQGDGDSNYAFLGSIARLSLGQKHGAFDWQVEFAAPFLLGLPEDAVGVGAQGQLGLGGTYYVANDRSRNAGMAFLKQGFLRFKNIGGNEAHSLRLGRFEFIDGTEIIPKNATLAALKRDRISQRLIGGFGWAHVMRSLDGFHYSYDPPAGNFTVIGAIPTRGVFQVDGWGPLETGFLYASWNTPFSAGKYSGELRLFGIYYHDWRHVLKTDNRAVSLRRQDMGNIRIGTFGGHYLHSAETAGGTLDFLVWGNEQTGRWGRLDHRAVAVAAEAGWQPRILPRLKPWVRGGYFYSTGDDDPLDSRHNTFFQMLPTPRPYARFPFFNLMNNRDILGMLILRPHPAVTVSSEVHALRLSASNDLWYQGGGAFQPWTFGYVGRTSNGGSGLATLYDISADYRLDRHVTLSGYYGYANGKSVISAIYLKGKGGSLGYLEVFYRF